ncbi:MAG: hypothetical protein ABI675_16405 [Chitinophagaceae bacterium]
MIDYLNLPGPIVFDGKSYKLSWTSHPSGNYYKQEYIVSGDNAIKFTTMLMVEVVTGDIKIKDAAAAKIEELKKMKEANPIVNYESFDNPKTGEYMIDFLLSENTADGKDISILERNVYRYMPFVDKAGKKGIILFGISTRSYGDKIQPFLVSLKSKKSDLVNKMAQYKFPELKIIR